METSTFVKAANVNNTRVVIRVNTDTSDMQVVEWDDLISDLGDIETDMRERGDGDADTIGLVFQLLKGM